MAHAYTAIMNGRDVRRFLDIPQSLYDRRILITVDPVEAAPQHELDKLQTLFAKAPTIRIPSEIVIEALTDEMNDC
jgi:hypothetical protein